MTTPASVLNDLPSPAKIKSTVSAAALHSARTLLGNFNIQPKERSALSGKVIPANEYNIAVLVDVTTVVGRVYEDLEAASVLLSKIEMESHLYSQPIQTRCADHRVEIVALLRKLDILFNRLPKYGQ